jgi:hypothetical protein
VAGIYLGTDNTIPVEYNVLNDELIISWFSLMPLDLKAGETLITLRLKSRPQTDGHLISLNLADNQLNELADGSFNTIEHAVLRSDILKFTSMGIDPAGSLTRIRLDNYPNPFDGTTTIIYSIPYEGNVTLEIHSALGNKIRHVVDDLQAAGDYAVEISDAGMQPGVYIATLTFESHGLVLKRNIRLVCQ